MHDEVYFWHVDKYQSFPLVDTIILGVHSQTCPKYRKEKVCIPFQYLHKNVGDEVDFLSADKHKIFL